MSYDKPGPTTYGERRQARIDELAAASVDESPGVSLIASAWSRLRRDPIFLLGLGITIAFVVLAIICAVDRAHDPAAAPLLDKVRPQSNPVPGPETGLPARCRRPWPRPAVPAARRQPADPDRGRARHAVRPDRRPGARHRAGSPAGGPGPGWSAGAPGRAAARRPGRGDPRGMIARITNAVVMPRPSRNTGLRRSRRHALAISETPGVSSIEAAASSSMRALRRSPYDRGRARRGSRGHLVLIRGSMMA